MGTLASELGPHVERSASEPRIYVDANMPARLVSFMRDVLHWDVLFVIEHDDLRRARDGEHYRLARQLRRTLITLDRDYLDDRKFPLEESGGVIVLMAPEENGYLKLLRRLDSEIFRVRAERSEPGERPEGSERPPLEGRKLHVHVDWSGAR
jgi:predicted nuclease of predicted toxin-antitoxin system